MRSRHYGPCSSDPIAPLHLSLPPLRYPSIWKYMIRLVERPACPEAYKEGMVRAEEASSGSSSNPLNALFGRKG